ncbi:hypothetical protein PEC18_35845 [Paucibacter sp. O1-1]|nr:hypothetical protein [Paucibacter sp. O1-1]MDA3831031.1 hypothetical protein [Paucibacter sp. O1-1]
MLPERQKFLGLGLQCASGVLLLLAVLQPTPAHLDAAETGLLGSYACFAGMLLGLHRQAGAFVRLQGGMHDRSRATAALRGLITGIDDGLIILMGGALPCSVAAVAALKQREGWAVRDPLRERRVLRRALRLGKACGVPALQAGRHSRMLMRAACRQQRRTQAACAVSPNRIEKARDTMISRLPFRSLATDLLGLLPPKRLAPVLAAIPSHWRAQWLERAVGQIVGGGDDEWAFLQGRRIGIEITGIRTRAGSSPTVNARPA